MCGRFALATEKKILEMLFDLEIRTNIDLRPRYNIAPSQQIAGLRLSPQNGEKELTVFKWGLVPFWARDQSIGSRMINARAETVATKPSFREAFKKRRMLIPASGFYEWKKEGKSKQPYYITRKDGRPFSFAGLWEHWGQGGESLQSCAIVTTEPNELLAPIHNRMPVIIPVEKYDNWLSPESDANELKYLLAPLTPEELILYPVTPLVNNPANDSTDLLINANISTDSIEK